jgi:ribonuclease VapC
VVLDASAVMGVLLAEADAAQLARAISRDRTRLISAATVLECEIATRRTRGDAGARQLNALLSTIRCEVVPFTLVQLVHARAAFARYGKGRHAAGLNFGDCFAYALAKATNEPLLFKGDDFTKTDVQRVV